MSRKEEDEIWNSFYEKFKFRSSVYAEDFPSISEPFPSMTFETAEKYSEDDIEDLETKVLLAFRRFVHKNEKICVLDWQHQCYWFYPHVNFEKWEIPVLPHGDYYIFLEMNLQFGIFGHPWEWTYCIWGKQLISFLENSKPSIWNKIKRQRL